MNGCITIPDNQIEDFGRVKTSFLVIGPLSRFLPYSIKVASKSDIKYINWMIQNNVIGWWSKIDYVSDLPNNRSYVYTFYFHNQNDAVLFKLRYADDYYIV